MIKRGNQTGYELPDSESVSYNPGYSDGGEAPDRDPLLQTDSEQDLSKREKVTLGNYLNKLTSGKAGDTSPNSFTVPDGSISTNGSGLKVSAAASSNQGPSLSLVQVRSAGTTNGTYSDLSLGYNPSAVRRFQDTKNSEYGSGDNPFKGSDIKNFDSDTRRRGQDGNSLLTSIQAVGEGPTDLGAPRVGQPPETVPDVQKRISAVIRNNRFNPIDNPFVEDKKKSDIGYTIQKEMGRYNPNAHRVSEEKLSKVGENVIIAASGAGSLKTFSSGIPLIDTRDLRAQSKDVSLPPVRTGEGQGSEALAAVAGGSSNSFGSSEYTSDVSSASSYGVMSSPIDRFSVAGNLSAARNLAVISSAVAAVNAVVYLFETDKFELSFRQKLGIGKLNAGTLSVQASVNNPLSQLGPTLPQSHVHRPGYELVMGRREIKTGDDSADNLTLPDLEDQRGALSDQSGALGSAALGLLTDPWISIYKKIVFSYKQSIPRTEHKISAAILRGSIIFLRDVHSDSSGYVASIARTISRDTYLSAAVAFGSITSLVGSLSSLGDVDPLTAASKIETSLQQISSIIDSFFRSQVFKFVMVLAQIGDWALIKDTYELELLENKLIAPDPEWAIHGSSRLSEFAISGFGDLGSQDKNALSWKHSKSPSLYILPENLVNAIDAYKTLASFDKTYGLKWSKISREKRLHSDEVKVIEEILDSEYMPFYFHDLRTNEIISFHAFLSDLSDGFTASYDSVAGYGRGDEVMTYKSTKRSISFSFSVVATSEEDLDVMYWNINKLVTMLYPQYSRGRAMKSGPDRFIQPFSQIPTASPLVRIRIGDIIKSNYSKFGIARLFGLGESPDVFSPQPGNNEQQTVVQEETPVVAPPPPTPAPAGRYAVGQVITIRPGIPTLNRFLNESGTSIERAADEQAAGEIPAGPSGTPAPPGAPDAPAAATIPRRRRPPAVPRALRLMPRRNRAKILSVSVVNDKVIYRVKIIRLVLTNVINISAMAGWQQADQWMSYDPSSLPTFWGASLEPIMSTSDWVPIATMGGEQNTVKNLNMLRRLREFVYADLDESEIVRPRTRRNRQNDESASSRSDASPEPVQSSTAAPSQPPQAQTLSEFLSSGGQGGNPLITSFESTRGRGLAGFITDIKFDWNESTWEHEQGNRAPKFMKINITFSPIHDIPMGLDNNGAMRSVAYNVGGLSKTIGDDPYDS